MRRLRAPFSAGRRTNGAGATTPAGAGPRSGGVNRRGLLGLLAVAPFVPAAARSAMVPDRLVVGAIDVQRAGALFTPSDEYLAAAQREIVDVIKGEGMVPRPDDVLALRRAQDAAWAELGIMSPVTPFPAIQPHAFIDDVGSGL